MVELLVSAVMFSLVALAIGYSLISARSLTSGSGDRRQALVLAQQRIEDLRTEEFDALALIVDNPTDENTVNGYPDYRRTTQVIYVEDNSFSTQAAGVTNSLRITVEITPTFGSGQTFSNVQLYTVMAR